MGHILQYCAKTIVVKEWRSSSSGDQTRTNGQEGSTVYLVGLDWKGIIYYELLLYGQTLNLDLYCQQLDRLKLAIDQNWPTEEVLCFIGTTPGHTRL
ncbi:hypothetical protein TNCV_3709031 [Trichonephila clavipes]|nr:hypothetical protein TNCV_3709031 [Trichonephila clavipes]